MKVKPLSHVQLFVTQWTVACQAPPSMGFSRQEYWRVAICLHPLFPCFSRWAGSLGQFSDSGKLNVFLLTDPLPRIWDLNSPRSGVGRLFASLPQFFQVAHHKRNKWPNWEKLVAMVPLVRAKPEVMVHI